MKLDIFIQVCIIICGLFIGAHFSKIAYLEHEKLGHSELAAHKDMNHGTLDISKEGIAPKITEFKLLKDPMSGWNINVDVSNFRFAPEQASQPHRQGEGHAHLYINGNKIGRLYSNWFHIPDFMKDKNEIKITLNSNDHQTLTIGNQAIEKIIIYETE